VDSVFWFLSGVVHSLREWIPSFGFCPVWSTRSASGFRPSLERIHSRSEWTTLIRNLDGIHSRSEWTTLIRNPDGIHSRSEWTTLIRNPDGIRSRSERTTTESDALRKPFFR